MSDLILDAKNLSRVVYLDLSYKICGILYRVQNELGEGYLEKHVQRAVATVLQKEGIKSREQVSTVMEFENKIIGRYFLDFVVEDKIVVELKIGERLAKKDFDQVKQYLTKTGLALGLLARFGRNGVIIHRILRPL